MYYSRPFTSPSHFASMPFASLGLDASILKAIADQGYTEPTPIQKATIPSIIEGLDVIGVAQTGTGKTAAFTLPLLTRLLRTKTNSNRARVRCLILAPTRELVVQIAENVAGFKIKIVNKFRFEERPKKLAYFYNQLRLYRKDVAGFKNSAVHDSVELKSSDNLKILQLKNIIFHQSFRSFSHWLEKINSYSSMQAQDAFAKGKCPSYLKVFLAPTVGFLKAFIVRRYFIYGLDGIIYSYIFALSRFAKAIKTRELFKANSIKDK
jgi:Rad3-related DNA helicase